MIKRWFSGRSSLQTLIPLMKRSSCIIAVSMIVIYARVLIMNGEPQFSEQDNPASFCENWNTRVLTFWYLPALNFWLLLCPSTLAYDWQLGSVPLITSLMDSRSCLTLGFYTLLLMILYVPFKRKDKDHTAVLWSVLVMVVSFLPASNIFFRVGFVLAERVLYIPSLGFCTLVGIGIDRLLCKFCLNEITQKDKSRRNAILTNVNSNVHQRFCVIILNKFVKHIESCIHALNMSISNFINLNIMRLITKIIYEKCSVCVKSNIDINYIINGNLKFYKDTINSYSRSKCRASSSEKSNSLNFETSVDRKSNLLIVLSYYKILKKTTSSYFCEFLDIMQRIKYTQKIKVTVIYLLTVFALKTLSRNLDWQNRDTLFSSGLKTLPQNAKMHYNFGNLMRDHRNGDHAMFHYKEAIRLWSCYPSAHNNLGTVLLEKGHIDLAERHFQEALIHHPEHHRAAHNLAIIWRKLGQATRAISLLEKYLMLRDSERIQLGLLLAHMYREKGQNKLALNLVKKLYALHVGNKEIEEAFNFYTHATDIGNKVKTATQKPSDFQYTFSEQAHIMKATISSTRKVLNSDIVKYESHPEYDIAIFKTVNTSPRETLLSEVLIKRFNHEKTMLEEAPGNCRNDSHIIGYNNVNNVVSL